MDSRLKFLIVLGHFGHMGGAERQAFHLIRFLRENLEAQVAVLGWTGDGPLVPTLRALGCEIFSFPYQPLQPKFRKGVNLLHLAVFIRKKIQPDIILPFVSVHSKPICQIWRLTGARYAWWNQQDEGRGLYGSKEEKRALLNAVHITSNSEAGTEFLSKTYGIPEERILTYNNGTVLPDINNLKPYWRNHLGLSPETKLISMVANITRFKDHLTLIKSWRIILNEYPSDQSPVLALAGHTKDKEYVKELKALAFDLRIGDSINFLGAIDSTDELMYESDLVVHSSLKEGCPNSVCEAMALGKAVVGTDIPGIRQALDRSFWKNCLAEPGNERELAEKIGQFLKDENLRNTTGIMNRRRIEEHFSIEGMCKFFCSLLDQAPIRPRRKSLFRLLDAS